MAAPPAAGGARGVGDVAAASGVHGLDDRRVPARDDEDGHEAS
jgi:hypothetical protein